MFKKLFAALAALALSLPSLLIAEPSADDADDSAASTGEARPEANAPGNDDDEEDDDDEEEDDDDENDGVGMVAIQTTNGGVVVSSNAERGDDDSDDDADETDPLWTLRIGGYLRTQFTAIADDPNVDFVGRHDGFRLANARLKFQGSMDNGLGFELELDGAVDRDLTSRDDPVVAVGARLKDAFLYYQPFEFLRVTAGQFKPPFDREELTSTSEILFINRSVGSRGVHNVEGYNVDGISLSRQPGLRVDAEPFYLWAEDDEKTGLGISYGLAMTNGQSAGGPGVNGANRSLNDNDKFAYYGRAALHWSDMVEIGGAYYLNNATAGERPDLVGVQKTGWTADVSFHKFGISFLGSVMQATESPEGTIPQAETTSLAYQAQIGYEEPFVGLEPTYRFAYFDPTSEFENQAQSVTFNNDALTYHTVGLNYNAQNYPIRLMANYTITAEQDQRQLANNRFDALLQMSW